MSAVYCSDETIMTPKDIGDDNVTVIVLRDGSGQDAVGVPEPVSKPYSLVCRATSASNGLNKINRLEGET